MAYLITGECIVCDACVPECPNEAITAGDEIYTIDVSLCTECVGFFYEPQCASVCPTECCEPNQDVIEEEVILLERAMYLHPTEVFDADHLPSHFRR